jgi:hypothetical protein
VLPLARVRSVREVAVLFAGDDWSEDHHDVEVQDGSGRVLGRARLGEGVAGITRFHELIGRFADPDAGRVRWRSGSRRTVARGWPR